MEPKKYLLLVLLFVNLVGPYVLGDYHLQKYITSKSNLTTPNYPENEGPGTKYKWVFIAPAGNRLRLVCTDIYRPESADGSRTVLTISNSRQVSNGTSSRVYESVYNVMRVQFATGASTEGRLNCVVAPFTQVLKQTDITNIPVTDEDKLVTEFPFMASILLKKKKGSLRCKGSILSQRHIITLATCLVHYLEKELVVIVDRNNLDAQTLDVGKRYAHENYSIYSEYKDNIGLLVLSEDIQFNQMVKPVCLPTEHYNLESVRAVGLEDELPEAPSRDLTVVRNLTTCNKRSNPKGHFGNFYTNGDSPKKIYPSRPLVYKDPELQAYVLVGLQGTSYRKCDTDNNRIVHTNTDIYLFHTWIQEKILLSRDSPGYRTCEKLEQRLLS